MESYYLQLTTSQKLPSGSTLNVTGYSLGGHLATVFTELHAAEIDHTYNFNGAGRGLVEGADSSLVAEESRIREMLHYFRVALNDPDMANPRFSRDNPIYDAAIVSHAADPGWDPFDQGAANFYSDPRYQWAKAATLWQFDTEGVSSIELTTNFLGEPGASGPFSKITALYGLAATGDLNVVANSGVHAAGAQPILIEGQPQIEGVLLFQDQAAFGNTHSIILIVDSLAVQELIHAIDFRYGQASAELLIKAASNAKADAIAPLVTPGVVEGDSLERTVDAFRKLFLGPTLPETYPWPVDSQVGGFGTLANRNEMYVAMASVREALQGWQDAGAIFTLTDLTDMSSLQSSEATSPENIAQAETAQGLAYRYALKELNPFALWADDDRVTDVLYEAHNTAGELDLFNEATGSGTLTAQYLADRAQFLAEKTALNLGDRETSSGNINFADYVVGNDDAISQIRYQIETGVNIQTHQEFLFGSHGLERLEGGSNEDHLYGGGQGQAPHDIVNRRLTMAKRKHPAPLDPSSPLCCPPDERASRQPAPVDLPVDDALANEELATFAKALGHPTRVRILRMLAKKEARMCSLIVDELPLAQSSVSEHLRILKAAGLIRGREDGPRVAYCIEPAVLRRMKALLEAL